MLYFYRVNTVDLNGDGYFTLKAELDFISEVGQVTNTVICKATCNES